MPGRDLPTLKCPACQAKHQGHGRCWRRTGEGTGQCCCPACWGRIDLAEALRIHEQGNNLGQAMDILGRVLGGAMQRYIRIDAIEGGAPVLQGPCHWLFCDNSVYGSKYGRRRLYCSRYHKWLMTQWNCARRREQDAA